MHPYAKGIAAAAVVLLAVVGCQSQPETGGVGGQPTVAPSPSPVLLARGSFVAKGGEVELDAVGDGDSVAGTMTVSHDGSTFKVDLKCARTAQDGRILIAGDTTDSTSPYAPNGVRTAIVLKPGTPVHAAFTFEEEGQPEDSCLSFLDGMIDHYATSTIGPDSLEPIEGIVELRS